MLPVQSKNTDNYTKIRKTERKSPSNTNLVKIFQLKKNNHDTKITQIEDKIPITTLLVNKKLIRINVKML